MPDLEDHERLAQELGLEPTRIDPSRMDLNLLVRTPARILAQRRAVPLHEIDGAVVVAFPGDPESTDLVFLRRVYGRHVEPRIAPRAEIEAICAAVGRHAASLRHASTESSLATQRSVSWSSEPHRPGASVLRRCAIVALLLAAWAFASNRLIFAWFEREAAARPPSGASGNPASYDR